MSSKTEYTCDVCGKPIEGDYEMYYMTTITVNEEMYHVHNGFSSQCMAKIWKILKRETGK